jgi:DNA polymerase-3 subunit gamma/tau
MSYQVLARKWRPRFFSEMVGQEHVLRALINALNDQRLHHAYLFTGTRGVGKTTIARILAKCLNCEKGVTSEPCGECSSCREISEGRFVDLIEVDAASRTKVEDTRELLDNVQYAPTRGRYKVYLIDEVHMLSTHSFNALLKTLEEPPEHVKFLLATTDPQKLPITVLSRCLQFSLKNMTPERVVGYLEHVLDAEKIAYEDAALWQLGRAAQGSMRDAISLTDQAIAYGQGEVFEHQVNAMLGTMDRGRIFKLAEILATGQVAPLLAEVDSMSEHGPDYDEVVQSLMQLWHKVAVAQVAPDSVDNSEGDRDAIMMLAAAMRAEDIQLFYQTALVGRKDLPLAADPRQGFEMILLRMLAFKPVSSAPVNLDLVSTLQAPQRTDAGSLVTETSVVEQVISEVPITEVVEVPVTENSVIETTEAQSTEEKHREAEDAVVEAGEAEKKPLAESESVSGSAENVSGLAEQAVVSEETPQRIAGGAAALLNNPLPVVEAIESQLSGADHSGEDQDAIKKTDIKQTDEHQVSSMVVSASGTSASVVSDVVERMAKEEHSEPEFQFDWQQLSSLNWWQWVRNLPLAGMPMAIALNSALVSRHENQLVMDVDPDQGALYNDGQRQRIEQALCDITGLSVQLQMHVQTPRGETPHQRRTRIMAERFAQAGHSIMEDEVVQSLVNEFEAHIVEGSIRPLGSRKQIN